MGQTSRQVRHYYVANKFEIADGFTADKHLDTKGDLGEMKAFVNDSKNHLYFEYRGHGGVTRSDLIPISNIEYINLSKKEDLRIKLAGKMVILPKGGHKQKFSINLKVSGIKNLNESDPLQVIAHYEDDGAGMVTPDKVAEVAIHLAKGAEKTLFNSVKIFVTASDDPTNLGTLTEVKASYKTETFLASLANSSIVPQSIVIIENKPEPWNEFNRVRRISLDVDSFVTEGSGPKIVNALLDYTNADNYVGNGILVKDDEYFYLGVRGNLYTSCSSYISASLGVADETQEYDVLDIHYSHIDSGNTSYKSEKDITIAGKKAELETLLEKLKGAKETTIVSPTAPKKGPSLEEC